MTSYYIQRPTSFRQLALLRTSGVKASEQLRKQVRLDNSPELLEGINYSPAQPTLQQQQIDKTIRTLRTQRRNLLVSALLMTVIAGLLAIEVVLLRAEPKASIELLTPSHGVAVMPPVVPITAANAIDALTQVRPAFQAIPGVQSVKDIQLIDSKSGPIVQIQATISLTERGTDVADAMHQIVATTASLNNPDLFVILNNGAQPMSYFWSNAAQRWSKIVPS